MNYYEQKRDFHKIQLDIAIAQNKPKAIKLHKTEFDNYSDEVNRQESKQKTMIAIKNTKTKRI